MQIAGCGVLRVGLITAYIVLGRLLTCQPRCFRAGRPRKAVVTVGIPLPHAALGCSLWLRTGVYAPRDQGMARFHELTKLA